VSKDVSSTESRKPVSFAHGVAVVAVVVIGGIIAFSVLGAVVGFFIHLVTIVAVLAAIAGVIWLVARSRR
jgi:hypothetical protein